MLKHDPIPWLLSQEGQDAVRARRSLGLECQDDDKVAQHIVRRMTRSHSTAGVRAGGAAAMSLQLSMPQRVLICHLPRRSWRPV